MNCHISHGSESKFAVVFSCPGKYEAAAQTPAAGATGSNLSLLLEILSEQLHLGILTREKITITNAWDRVEYKALTSRTEASNTEIISTTNINRLCSELDHITDLIVCFGDKALLAVNICNLSDSVKVVTSQHLSNKAINHIRFDINNNPILSAQNARANGDRRSLRAIGKENTKLRIAVISKHIRK